MKTFGLYQRGVEEPIETIDGVMTVTLGMIVSVLGEPGADKEREVLAEISLRPGESVREVKARE